MKVSLERERERVFVLVRDGLCKYEEYIVICRFILSLIRTYVFNYVVRISICSYLNLLL